MSREFTIALAFMHPLQWVTMLATTSFRFRSDFSISFNCLQFTASDISAFVSMSKLYGADHARISAAASKLLAVLYLLC